jgi:UDP-N-acetylmuramoyl-tripeptide--D-alanyl-D-alanine ligase
MQLSELYSIFLQNPIICTDTRKLSKGCLFFALKGDNFNGNKFAKQAIEEGAAYAIIDEEQYQKNDQCLLVNNVLETLQGLAKCHRQQLALPVIAIVGSNGKTTTKELITSVLQTKYNLLSTPGNFNNHIGLPLTLLMLKKEHQLAVIEMGANHVTENAFLCEIAVPSHGLVTNNGKDHLEGFGSMEGVIQSNAELFDYLEKHQGIAFVNCHDEVLMNKSKHIKSRILYGNSEQEKISEIETFIKPNYFQPTINFQLQGLNINSPLSGDYNFDNILAAISIGLHFGLNPEEIKKGIEAYSPKNLRSQLIEKENNRIFLDAYNANPSSMEASIRNFMAMPGENKVLILGDMFELGKYEEEEHQNMVQFCLNQKVEQAILVGKAFNKTQTNYQKFETTPELIDFLKSNPIANSFVFLKGSRGMKIESLVDVL